jgi:uncharacterized OB-fold protein
MAGKKLTQARFVCSSCGGVWFYHANNRCPSCGGEVKMREVEFNEAGEVVQPEAKE